MSLKHNRKLSLPIQNISFSARILHSICVGEKVDKVEDKICFWISRWCRACQLTQSGCSINWWHFCSKPSSCSHLGTLSAQALRGINTFCCSLRHDVVFNETEHLGNFRSFHPGTTSLWINVQRLLSNPEAEGFQMTKNNQCPKLKLL